jgi:hypothetical protein
VGRTKENSADLTRLRRLIAEALAIADELDLSLLGAKLSECEYLAGSASDEDSANDR